MFVGRWSKQKGIDIIADVFFSVLKDNPKTQLICIGPVIDLYGKFAALKLEKLMARFPGRVYSRPEFTALPPCIFGGAEFALIPSRDEPFGLVAVEFGRKGALGVGSKVGGLGQMPGWWYTVESLTSKHLIYQFKQAIRSALASDHATRAKMRAQALVQRFPVQQWVEDLDKLQATSIQISRHQQEYGSLGQTILRTFSPSSSGFTTPTLLSRAQTPTVEGACSPSFGSAPPSRAGPPGTALQGLSRVESDGSLQTLGQEIAPAPVLEQPIPRADYRPFFRREDSISQLSSMSIRENALGSGQNAPAIGLLRDSRMNSPQSSRPSSPSQTSRGSTWNMRRFNRASAAPSSPSTPQAETVTGETESARKEKHRFSYSTIVDKKNNFELQKVDVNFTDSQNEFYDKFARKLDQIDAKTSEGQLCIEEFLTKSEKVWFGRFHRAKLGMNPENAHPTTLPGLFRWLKRRWRTVNQSHDDNEAGASSVDDHGSLPGPNGDAQFLLGEQYEPPSGIKRILQKKVGDWQLYCFLLAFVSKISHPLRGFTKAMLTSQGSNHICELLPNHNPHRRIRKGGGKTLCDRRCLHCGYSLLVDTFP